MERLIEVSHWGNIAVEEFIEIEHVGAKLKVCLFHKLIRSFSKLFLEFIFALRLSTRSTSRKTTIRFRI
jgi:hypothetical protein